MIIKKYMQMLFLLIACTSCGTEMIISIDRERHSFDTPEKQRYYKSYKDFAKYNLCKTTPNIYGGTIYTFREICDPCNHGETATVLSGILLPFTIIDLPLCIIADTLVLPYTVYRQIEYGYVYDNSPNKRK
jgi:uncharacterized protein YceK